METIESKFDVIRDLKTHNGNELHKFCRMVDSYVNEGHCKLEAYCYVKKLYKLLTSQSVNHIFTENIHH